jgi:hypothetical protein
LKNSECIGECSVRIPDLPAGFNSGFATNFGGSKEEGPIFCGGHKMRIKGQRVSNDQRLMKDDSLKENGIWNRYLVMKNTYARLPIKHIFKIKSF